jgi:lysophospholipase
MMTDQSPPRDVTITSKGGVLLRAWYWTRPHPAGVLVIFHGFGEHGACYRHVVDVLGPALELDVLAPDQRGHGRSPGRRGVVGQYDDLVADVNAALDWATRERPGLPCFLLGHSNGGLLALRLMLMSTLNSSSRNGDGQPMIPASPAGLILSNPALRIVTPIPPLKLLVGQLLLRFAPWVTLSGRLDASLMTRDPASQHEHNTDPVRHSRMSAPLFFGMAAAGEHAIEHADAITTPVLMLLGGSDPVIDSATSRQVFERLGSADKRLHVYPPMLHEPLNEIDRKEVYRDIEAWLRPRLGRRQPTS